MNITILKELGLTPKDAKELLKKYDDLQIQSMMFDMDIDIETLSLSERREDKEPKWLKDWKEKQNISDNDPASPEQAGW